MPTCRTSRLWSFVYLPGINLVILILFIPMFSVATTIEIAWQVLNSVRTQLIGWSDAGLAFYRYAQWRAD